MVAGETPPIEYHQGKSIYINEAGLYTLIFGSKLESAELFKDYVFEEVLPRIRKKWIFRFR